MPSSPENLMNLLELYLVPRRFIVLRFYITLLFDMVFEFPKNRENFQSFSKKVDPCHFGMLDNEIFLVGCGRLHWTAYIEWTSSNGFFALHALPDRNNCLVIVIVLVPNSNGFYCLSRSKRFNDCTLQKYHT